MWAAFSSAVKNSINPKKKNKKKKALLVKPFIKMLTEDVDISYGIML